MSDTQLLIERNMYRAAYERATAELNQLKGIAPTLQGLHSIDRSNIKDGDPFTIDLSGQQYQGVWDSKASYVSITPIDREREGYGS